MLIPTFSHHFDFRSTSIKEVGSILDKTGLSTDSWHVSVLDLSDNHHNQPSATFILLEQRNYAGQHVIHQLKLHQGEGKVSSYAMNPLAVNQLKQAIFGQMVPILTKPRYYATSFTLSQKLGEQLIKAGQQIKTSEKDYEFWHKLAVDYKTLQANQQRKASDTLSLPWNKYIQHPAVKKYKREQLYEAAMGSGGMNVYVNKVNIGKMYNF